MWWPQDPASRGTQSRHFTAGHAKTEPIVALRTLLGVRHTKATGATSAGESSDAAVAFGRLFGHHAQAVYTFSKNEAKTAHDVAPIPRATY